MKVGLVNELAKSYGLNKVLSAVELSKGSYYRKRFNLDKIRTFTNRYLSLKEKVIVILSKNPAYGYRRIIEDLKGQGITINHKPLKRLLKAWGLIIKRRIKRVSPSGIQKKLLSFWEREQTF